MAADLIHQILDRGRGAWGHRVQRRSERRLRVALDLAEGVAHGADDVPDGRIDAFHAVDDRAAGPREERHRLVDALAHHALDGLQRFGERRRLRDLPDAFQGRAHGGLRVGGHRLDDTGDLAGLWERHVRDVQGRRVRCS